jgi:phosphoribosylglycinamide formyltransferase-1
MKKLVVLISGRGSNMGAIAEACAAFGWPARIAAVIADRPGAAGLATAAGLGLATEVVDHREAGSREAFDQALCARVDRHDPDLVVLAGFMRILGAPFIERFSGRLLNIHPSLLPAFPGLHTHRRALAAGVRIHGATVHAVSGELDGGPILAQAAVPVSEHDDERTLAARVLAAEHRLYPMVVGWLVEGRMRLSAEGGRWVEGVVPSPRWLWAD